MHFTPLIRNLALQHTATSCISEDCLLCEMGFLFDMLKKAEGSICQATNLLKTLSQQPQGPTWPSRHVCCAMLILSIAANLGLLEEDLNNTSLPAMLQRLARFLFDRIVDNFRLQSTGPNLMQQVCCHSLHNLLPTELTSTALGGANNCHGVYPMHELSERVHTTRPD